MARRNDRAKHDSDDAAAESDRKAKARDSQSEERADDDKAIKPNPPRTTLGKWFTAPKFGSAGSGGAELDPGPERD